MSDDLSPEAIAKMRLDIDTLKENYKRIWEGIKELQNHEDRITSLEEATLILRANLQNHEDRITSIEEVTLILRAQIEPESLTAEALERADKLHTERWGSF